MEEFPVKEFITKHSSSVDILRKSLSAKFSHLADQCELLPVKWEEIGDGNINFIYRVWISTGGSDNVDSNNTVVIKYAPTYIRCLGPAYLLTQDRLELEYKAMCKFHELHPFSVPVPLLYDKEYSAVLMEDLSGYNVMRTSLIQGIINIPAINNIMVSIATIHSSTTRQSLGDDSYQNMCQTLKNPAMTGITDQYIFTKPYLQDDETNKHHPLLNDAIQRLRANEEACQEAKRMRTLFLECPQCICHGDLHTGSIMNNNDSSKMFDLEFAFMGPATFDFGMFLANLIFAMIRHHILKNTVAVHTLHESIRGAIESYYKGENSGLITGSDNFIADTCRFIGCELVRRVVGAAHVSDIQSLPEGELLSLQLGEEFLLIDNKEKNEDLVKLITDRLKIRLN